MALGHLRYLAVVAVALRGRHGLHRAILSVALRHSGLLAVLAVTLGHLRLLAVHTVAWNRHLDEAASPRRATMAVGPVLRVMATLARRHDYNRRDDRVLLLSRRLASLGRAVVLAVRAVNDLRRALHHSCRWEYRHRNVGGSGMLPGVAIDNPWRASGDDSWGGVSLGHGTSGHGANDKQRANHIE